MIHILVAASQEYVNTYSTRRDGSVYVRNKVRVNPNPNPSAGRVS